MSTNYYVKTNKSHLDAKEVNNMVNGYQEIHNLLMEKVRSNNQFVEEWANEALAKLEQDHKNSAHNFLHIGKYSGGHRFTLQSKFQTWTEWKNYLKNFDGMIVDEYDNEVSLEELDKSVLSTLQFDVKYKEMKLSEDGFYLHDGEFS